MAELGIYLIAGLPRLRLAMTIDRYLLN